VRNRLILKELEKTVAFKCGSSVRNRLISKELRETFALKCAAGEKAPLPLAPFADALGKRGKEELKKPEEVWEAVWAAIRRGWASVYTGKNSKPVWIG
jgi:hypothetical protein